MAANLLIEYIGYDCFQKTVEQVQPKYVSCIIQINVDDSWVSDSPYIHVFDDLDKVHLTHRAFALKLKADYANIYLNFNLVSGGRNRGLVFKGMSAGEKQNLEKRIHNRER